MNASPQTNMNASKNEPKVSDAPSNGSNASNWKADWRKARLLPNGGELTLSEKGKIESCVITLQQKAKNSPEFKDALGHMWDYYYLLVATNRMSFCSDLGLTVAEAEVILDRANRSASKAAPGASTATKTDHTAKTAVEPVGQPNVKKREDSNPPNHAARADAPEPQPEAVKPAPSSRPQRRSQNKGKKPSTPSDKKAQPVATGEKKANIDADAANTTKPAPGSSREAPAIPAYEDHPLADLFPLDDGAELDQLTDDIRRTGLQEPIVLFENKILDGRRRYRGCLRSGTAPIFADFAGHDPAAFVLSKNIHRRNLEKGQRAAIAAELLLFIQKEARERKITTNGTARDNQGRFSEKPRVEKIPPTDGNEEADPQAAAIEQRKSRDVAGTALDVNPHYVSDAKAIMENAPDLHKQLKQGEITIFQAKRELAKRKPKSESKPNKKSKVEAQPFSIVLWDQSDADTQMPEILRDKKKRKTLTSAAVFHLTAQPQFALGCDGKDGLRDAALFVIPLGAPEPEEGDGLTLQKPSCLFLVARTCGAVPKPATVPDQVIKGGAVEVRMMIEKMWPSAPRLISNGNGSPPEGWEVS